MKRRSRGAERSGEGFGGEGDVAGDHGDAEVEGVEEGLHFGETSGIGVHAGLRGAHVDGVVAAGGGQPRQLREAEARAVFYFEVFGDPDGQG